MADEQISFYSTSNVEDLPLKEGSVIISKRDEEKRLADLFADLGGKRYQLKPSYNWEELQNSPDFEAYINNQVEAELGKILLKYFYIEQEITSDEEIKLNIYANEGYEPVTSDGEIVTLNDLQNGVENGTFLVGDRAISIGGLRSAAYTESDDYTPMNTSIWTDL